MSGESQDELERELDMLLAKIEMPVLPDRKAGIIAGYAEQKRMAAILRRHPLGLLDEPSNTFDLATILRSA